jgi:hypothetical protein
MFELLVEFFEAHQGILLTTFLGLIGFLFLRWANSRRARLSKPAKKLFNRLKSDPTHETKGITLHRCDAMVNYRPFRVLDSDNVEIGMVYELDGEYLEVVNAVEEMVAKGYLVPEDASGRGLEVYRLNN